jgi:DNA mismatch repair protein MutS2
VRVVRETPAYRLCALERDVPALLAETERDGERRLLAAEEERVRRDLAGGVARERDTIIAATQRLGELDCALARVALVHRFGGCVPAFDDAAFVLDDATFAPLAEALAGDGRRYTPLSFAIDGTAVLTGPNMGGKSAALALCGFVALCVAAGLPPPARAVTLPLFRRVVWIGGGDADRARLLSAFATEVVRARDALADDAVPALVLVDEYARTTGPREGRALLVALVEALATRPETTAFVATHFDGVAETAGVAHLWVTGAARTALDGIVPGDLHDALTALGGAIDYRIVPGGAGPASGSDAIALARVLGLPAALVARASTIYDS